MEWVFFIFISQPMDGVMEDIRYNNAYLSLIWDANGLSVVSCLYYRSLSINQLSMALKVARTTEHKQFGAAAAAAASRSKRPEQTCVYWLAGRCNRNPCRFLHRITPSPSPSPSSAYHYANNNAAKSAYCYTRKPNFDSSPGKPSPSPSSAAAPYYKNAKSANPYTRKTQPQSDSSPESDTENHKTKCSKTAALSRNSTTNVDTQAQVSPSPSQEKPPIICKYWMNDSCCVHGDQCHNLHSLCCGDGLSSLAKLEGHNKVVSGIALPAGSDKLYSGSTDGTVRIWDCHTGQCVNVINLGAEVNSLITEGPWIFVGLRDVVKAWNIQTASEFTLDGPKGRVLSMNVANDTLFAAAEDGVIYAWRGSSNSEAKSPFELVASLTGHTKAVVSLTVGCNSTRLYSGSMDNTIKVWDVDTLECKMTLNGHTDTVTSLICWTNFLISSSADCTIKVWACPATGEGPLEVIYTHTVETGILALNGMTDAEGNHILCCSCKDNSVHLYELPSFSERGRLFAKREVRSMEIVPDGLLFTGDGTGLLNVWKWSEEPKLLASSS